MISYPVYKVLHLVGVMMVFLSLGGALLGNSNTRKRVAITHGLGMLFALVGGFGLLARLGLVNGLPGWAIAKLGIWIIFGGSLAIALRKPKVAPAMWILVLALGALAAYLAGSKPF